MCRIMMRARVTRVPKGVHWYVCGLPIKDLTDMYCLRGSYGYGKILASLNCLQMCFLFDYKKIRLIGYMHIDICITRQIDGDLLGDILWPFNAVTLLLEVDFV